MFRFITVSLFILFVNTQVWSQSFWSSIDEEEIILSINQERTVSPIEYLTFELSYANMKRFLEAAPKENYGSNIQSQISLELPMPNGKLETFYMYRSTAMMDKITARYPGIISYVGYSENGSNVILDFSSNGFHAGIWTSNGYVYIDPYVSNGDKYYISYFTKDDMDIDALSTSCGLEFDELEQQHKSSLTINGFRTENIPLHTYRLALACTGEHGSRFDTVEDVIADMNTGINRLNLIFLNELSIKVVMVNDNEKIIFQDKNTDPYPIGDVGASILQLNTAILNQRIGSNKYDLGHVFTKRCTDVGGIAYLGSVCNGNKGGGVTCLTSANNIDFTMVRITAHEMGHQFGAGHTFNNCSGNESLTTAFEPGGGSTIMSYGGLCGTNSFVFTNDDYYHNISLQQMFQHTRVGSGSLCGTTMDIGNHAPVAIHDYKDGFYIPISTPFELTGDATDEDGDNMTFVWEQMDNGPIVPLGTSSTESPLFRTYPPSIKKTRYLPLVDNVRYNVVDPAEVMATQSRDLKFRFVVRDNHPGGGLADWKQVDFKATADAGPFVVNYPNINNLSFEVGNPMVVTWDVANTDGSKVNTQFVDLYYSNDDGKTFPKLLAFKVPNDGSHEITLPNSLSTQSRIKVKAHDNIFYDMGDRSFEIEEPLNGFYFEFEDVYQEYCLPAETSFEISTVGFGSFSDDIIFDIIDTLPLGVVASFSDNTVLPNASTILHIDMLSANITDQISIRVRGVSNNSDTIIQTILLDLTSNNFSEFKLSEPSDNTSGAERLMKFSWNEVADATSYTLELATSPAFGVSDIVVVKEGIEEGFFDYDQLLELNTVYYWRVKSDNYCGEVSTSIYVFATKTKSCKSYKALNLPKSISTLGTPTVEAIFDIASTSTVIDVNVKNIEVSHDYIGSISGKLISPSGTEVQLWHKKCSILGIVNCGFDDESIAPIFCPMTSKIFKPLDSLAIFNGEPIDGQWRLSLKDNKAGNGGAFTFSEIELCADESFNSPYIYKYSELGVQPDNGNILSNDFLWVKDDDNVPSELVFTIVSLPEHGSIRYDNSPMVIGQNFTQDAIDNLRISYRHNGVDDVDKDSFDYVVIDGAGGWIPKSTFEIYIGSQYPDVVENVDFSDTFNIYPNPANSQLHITQLLGDNLAYDLKIYDLNGKLMKEIYTINNNILNLPLYNFTTGIYVIEISRGEKKLHRKLSIIR